MLVFDLDDTLYLERDFAFSGYRQLENRLALSHHCEGFAEVCRGFLEAGETHVIDAALGTVGIKDEGGLSAELIELYRNHTPDITLAEDVVRYFNTARKHRPFGLITDGYERTQAGKVAALGLKDRVEHICLTATLGEGRGKPHPAAYETMEAAEPDEALYCYVADNPAKDFVTPKARGWLCLQIVRPGGIHPTEPSDEAHAPHARIVSFDDLDEAFSSFEYERLVNSTL